MKQTVIAIISIVLIVGTVAWLLSDNNTGWVSKEAEGRRTFKSQPYQTLTQTPSYGMPKKLRPYAKNIVRHPEMPSPPDITYETDGKQSILCFNCRVSPYSHPYAKIEEPRGVCIVRHLQYGDECKGIELSTNEPCTCPKPSQEMIMRYAD